MKPLVIVGCGGFGREVHDVVTAINAITHTWDLVGYVDDAPSDENQRLVSARGSTILGPLSWLDAHSESLWYVIGIGDGADRARIDTRLRTRHRAAPLVHPAATLGFDVRIGDGSIICAGARLTTNITLGRHAQVHIGSTVGHDSHVGEYATVLPLAAIAGRVRLGTQSMVGTNAAVLQGLSVGDRSVVGACACATKNVPADTLVRGVPAT